MVTVAVPGLHVDIGGGASTPLAGGLHGLELGGLGTLRVEVALAGDLALWGGDQAPEVEMRRCEASGLVGQFHGALDVCGLERVVTVAAVDSGLAEYWWPVTVSS